MSDPRLIPADEARETLREVQEPKVNLPWSNAWVGDLAHTVVEQAAQIEQLDTALGAVAPQSLAQGRKLRRQAAQIERVREVLHRIEQADEQAQHDWDTNYNPDSQHEALAYSMAAQWLEEALGDTEH